MLVASSTGRRTLLINYNRVEAHTESYVALIPYAAPASLGVPHHSTPEWPRKATDTHLWLDLINLLLPPCTRRASVAPQESYQIADHQSKPSITGSAGTVVNSISSKYLRLQTLVIFSWVLDKTPARKGLGLLGSSELF